MARSFATPAASRKFYCDALSLPFKEDASGYLHTGELDGVKHFALWPLAQAAESCFGTDQWPGDLPVPQAWIEFDVGNIQKATAELKSQGYQLLVATRTEPWGQVVTRLAGTGRSAGGHHAYAVDAEVNCCPQSLVAGNGLLNNCIRPATSMVMTGGDATRR